MVGAVRSNWFKVKDPAAFKAWFNENCYFGDDIIVFEGDSPDLLAIGGYEMYPTAYPRVPYDEDTDVTAEWDLQAFQEAILNHLIPGQEFRVLAVGNEKLRYVAATHLIITEVSVVFSDYYEGN